MQIGYSYDSSLYVVISEIHIWKCIAVYVEAHIKLSYCVICLYRHILLENVSTVNDTSFLTRPAVNIAVNKIDI